MRLPPLSARPLSLRASSSRLHRQQQRSETDRRGSWLRGRRGWEAALILSGDLWQTQHVSVLRRRRRASLERRFSNSLTASFSRYLEETAKPGQRVTDAVTDLGPDALVDLLHPGPGSVELRGRRLCPRLAGSSPGGRLAPLKTFHQWLHYRCPACRRAVWSSFKAPKPAPKFQLGRRRPG